MSATDDAAGDAPLPEESVKRLAEALGGEADMESAELTEARELAGLSLEAFQDLAEITEALEFRGVSREAESLPDPDWVKDVVSRTMPGGASDQETAPAPLGQAKPEDLARAQQPQPRRPELWLVPLVLAAAAAVFMLIRPDTASTGPGRGGFEGDPGAVLNGDSPGTNIRRALLSSTARSLVLPLDLSAGDEVRASIREAQDASTWKPITLKSSTAEIPIPASEWATVDSNAEYVVELVVYRLSSGSEERVTLPLHWQP